jgi:cytochrome c5
MPRRLTLAGLALALAGCGAVIPPVTPDLVAQAKARGVVTDTAQLERGRMIYTTRCNTCHSLHDPTEKTVAQWPGVVAIMGPRAYLPEAQRADVLAFLQATGAP